MAVTSSSAASPRPSSPRRSPPSSSTPRRPNPRGDHSHDPIAAVFEIWFPWQNSDEPSVKARVLEIIDALDAETGPLRTLVGPVHAPAWQGKREGFGEPDLAIGAAFSDLQAGFSAVARIVFDIEPDAHLRVRVSESPAQGDPFAHLRPSSPPRR